jgi:hypothetical protein
MNCRIYWFLFHNSFISSFFNSLGSDVLVCLIIVPLNRPEFFCFITTNFCLIFCQRGILYQEQSRYPEAIQSYKLAIQCRPRLTSAYFVSDCYKCKEKNVEVVNFSKSFHDYFCFMCISFNWKQLWAEFLYVNRLRQEFQHRRLYKINLPKAT